MARGEMAEFAGTSEPPLPRFGEEHMDSTSGLCCSSSIFQEDPAEAKGVPPTAWSALTELHSWLLGLSLFQLALPISKLL